MSQTYTDDTYASGHVAATDLQNIEDNFSALKTKFSGTSAPSNTVALLDWYDTTNGIWKLRDGSDAAWINFYDVTNEEIVADIANTVRQPAIVSGENIAPLSITSSASVPNTALKTSTGITSGTGANNWVNITMQDYCFFPSAYQDNVNQAIYNYNSTGDPGNTVGRFRMYCNTGRAYAVRWRYATASDRPFIYALQDKKSGAIKHIWACDDPPPGYWGMKEPPPDFRPPITFLEPVKKMKKLIGWLKKRRMKATPMPIVDKEIITFDYPIEQYMELRQRSDRDRVALHEMLTKDYEKPAGQKVFRRKNLSMT